MLVKSGLKIFFQEVLTEVPYALTFVQRIQNFFTSISVKILFFLILL